MSTLRRRSKRKNMSLIKIYSHIQPNTHTHIHYIHKDKDQIIQVDVKHNKDFPFRNTATLRELKSNKQK